jgi:hypothetical protein
MPAGRPTMSAMNLTQAGLGPLRRLLRRGTHPTCFVCKGHILPSEERMRLRGEAVVHQRCATYRMRTHRGASSRSGFPG